MNNKEYRRHLIRIKRGLEYLRINEISKQEVERQLKIFAEEYNQYKEFKRKVS